MGKIVVADKVESADLGLINAQIVGRGLNHPFLEEHRLRNAERASVSDSARCLVGINAPGL